MKRNWNYDNQDKWCICCGNSQSPINIDTKNLKSSRNLYKIEISYKDDCTYVFNNGRSIQVGTKGSKALINRREFNLIQFHFHSLSEHTIDGKHYPMEVHFVHTAETGAIAAIGIMLQEGKENKAFSKVLKKISKTENIKIDYKELLPQEKGYYHYLGSLTTPPLTEGVEWYVYTNPVDLSKEQIEEFRKYYDNNYRKVQDIGEREILIFKNKT